MISLDKFTELAHRTASRYSHRSEPEKVAYTFLPHTLADFHGQVCASLGADEEIERLRGELRKIRDCKTLEEAQDIARLARTQPNTEAEQPARAGETR